MNDIQHEFSDKSQNDPIVNLQSFSKNNTQEINHQKFLAYHDPLVEFSIEGISIKIEDDLLEINVDPCIISSDLTISTIRFILSVLIDIKYLYITILNPDSEIISINPVDFIYTYSDPFLSHQIPRVYVDLDFIIKFTEITELNIKEITIEDNSEGEADHFIKDLTKNFQITEFIFTRWSIVFITEMINTGSLINVNQLRIEKARSSEQQIVEFVLSWRSNRIVSEN